MSQAAATGNSDRFALVGTTLEGRFRVQRQVAEGGFGVVYDVHHVGLDARVALKVLKVPEELGAAARTDFIEKFLTEAKTMARIRHPHIVQVLDTGASVMPSGERAPWIVLEWLDGQTLDQDLRRAGPRSPAHVLSVLRPVLEAVAYAHDEQIAHRDLKPENVMLVQGKRGMMPKLLDFGIAKLMEQGESAGSGGTKTSSKFVGFSPYYAAPEQIGQARTGPWTDVHALGLIVSEMLVGHPVLPHGEMTETIRECYSHIRPTPAKFGVNVGSWEQVLQRALAYKPDQRFGSAGELLAALDQTLPGTMHSGLGAAGAPTYPHPGTAPHSNSSPMGAARGGAYSNSSPVGVPGGGWTPPPVPTGGAPMQGGWTPPPVPTANAGTPGGWTPPPQAARGGAPAPGGWTPPPVPTANAGTPGGWTPAPIPNAHAAPMGGAPAPGGWTPPPVPTSMGMPATANTGGGPAGAPNQAGWSGNAPVAPNQAGWSGNAPVAPGPWHDSMQQQVGGQTGGHRAVPSSGTMVMEAPVGLAMMNPMQPPPMGMPMHSGATTLSGAAGVRDVAPAAPKRSRAPLIAVGAVVLLAAIGGGVFFATRGDDEGDEAPRAAASAPATNNTNAAMAPNAAGMQPTAVQPTAMQPAPVAPAPAPVAANPPAPVAPAPVAPAPAPAPVAANPPAPAPAPVAPAPANTPPPAPVNTAAAPPVEPVAAPGSESGRSGSSHGSHSRHGTPTINLPVEPPTRTVRPPPATHVGTNGTEIL